MKSQSSNRKWTRRCPWYTQALQNTSRRLGISQKEAEKIILKYIQMCKKNLMEGSKVGFPGIINMSVYHMQLKRLRKFMSYKEMKRQYGSKQYFKNHIRKKKNE